MTMLALMLGIDFEPVETFHTYDPIWQARVTSGQLTIEDVREAAKSQVGVIREIKVTLKAVKS